MADDLVGQARSLAMQIDPMLLGGPDARLLLALAARIQALETSLAEVTEDRDLWKQSEAVASAQYDKACEKLAEAEGRVKDQIVNAIKTHPNFGDEDFGPGLDLAISIATAGEWKK